MIKYKDLEIAPIKEPQVFDPPRRMLCWNSIHRSPVVAYVAAILPKSSNCRSCVICTPTYCNYEYCAEIPQSESRRASIRELNEWLSKGHGERKDLDLCVVSSAPSPYKEREGNKPVEECCLVRKWCDKEWHAPTAEYLGIKEEC